MKSTAIVSAFQMFTSRECCTYSITLAFDVTEFSPLKLTVLVQTTTNKYYNVKTKHGENCNENKCLYLQ